MPNWVLVIVAVLAFGLLMAAHEGGHFLVARIFKMRVLKFSIGFGPVLWSKRPEGSSTTYQIGILPLLAYVQIAGMNPHEEIDPNDKASYANASWLGRFLTILAGPVANYLLAVVLFFGMLAAAGTAEPDGMKIGRIDPGSPAASSNLQVGDEIRTVDGAPVHDWSELAAHVTSHKDSDVFLVVERSGQPIEIHVRPAKETGRIGVLQKVLRKPMPIAEAAKVAIVEPPKIAGSMVASFGRLITGKEKPVFHGPVQIMSDTTEQFRFGWTYGVSFVSLLSIYVCVFNLIPFPALDGGRLAFLIYELIARRRADAKIEARVHMVGMLTLLSIMFPIFFRELWETARRIFMKG